MKCNLMKSGTNLHLQRGASLLEGIAYLGVAAVVVLGAVSLLGSAFSSAQTNRAVEEVISLRTAVKKLYMAQGGSYPGSASSAESMNSTLINVKAVPGSLKVDGTTLTNGWGGTVAVSGHGATFSISYAGLPAAECISLMMSANGWISVQQGTGGTVVTSFPVAASTASAQCNGSPNNTLSFVAS